MVTPPHSQDPGEEGPKSAREEEDSSSSPTLRESWDSLVQRIRESTPMDWAVGTKPAGTKITGLTDAVKFSSTISDEIKRENELVSSRMTWVLTFQGFVFASYALAEKSSGSDRVEQDSRSAVFWTNWIADWKAAHAHHHHGYRSSMARFVDAKRAIRFESGEAA